MTAEGSMPTYAGRPTLLTFQGSMCLSRDAYPLAQASVEQPKKLGGLDLEAL